jgi:hypothetical protein
MIFAFAWGGSGLVADIAEPHHVRLQTPGFGNPEARLVRIVEEADAFAQKDGIEKHPIFVDGIQSLEAFD